MKFFPADRHPAAQVKTFVEQLDSLALGALVGLLLAHQDFKLPRKQSADGSVTPGGNDLGLANCLAVQADSDILLHNTLHSSARAPRVARKICIARKIRMHKGT